MEVARKSWELDNRIKLVDPTRDALYDYDNDRQTEINSAKPWKDNPHHFRHVRISAVALIKMVMHARSGGSIEIMGIMQGYTDGDTIVVTDAFGLPVEGTETRVNAQDDALEYMVSYLSLCRAQGSRQENPVGWYHSHPGYGCWLSGIDVGTQSMQQQFNDPFVAVVIDPDRTISAGRVEIGAFRTYPDDYKPPLSMSTISPTTTTTNSSSSPHHATTTTSSSSAGGSAAVPLAKAEDFGAHASRYYSLEVSHFKSTLDSSLLDLLWSKYWVQTLSQNPLLTNRDYGNKTLLDLGSKIRDTTASYQRAAKGGGMGLHGGGGGGVVGVGVGGVGGGGGGKGAIDQEVDKLARTSHLVTMNEKQGLMAVEVKAKLFNGLGGAADATDTATEPPVVAAAAATTTVSMT